MDTELEKQLVGTYCVCYNVMYSEISLYIQNMKSIKRIEDLQKYMSCCAKCKLCASDIQKIIDFHRK